MSLPSPGWLAEYRDQLERFALLVGNLNYDQIAQSVRQLIPQNRRVTYLRRVFGLRDEFHDTFKRDLPTTFFAATVNAVIRDSRAPVRSLVEVYVGLEFHGDLATVASSLFTFMNWDDLPDHDLYLLRVSGLNDDDVRRLVEDAKSRIEFRGQTGLMRDVVLLSRTDESFERARQAVRQLREIEKRWKGTEAGLLVPEDFHRTKKRGIVDQLGKLLAGTIQLGGDLGLGIGIWPALPGTGPVAAGVLSGLLWSATNGVINITDALSHLIENDLIN